MSSEPNDAEGNIASAGSAPRLSSVLSEGRAGYHRLFLAFALALICASLLLPGPGSGGEVRLPGLDTPLPTICMLKREFGVDCPGCGLTRCFLAMGHARVASAWAYHPTGVLLFALVVVQIPYRLVQIWRIRRGHKEITHWMFHAVLWLLAAAILGQWILRMAGVLAVNA